MNTITTKRLLLYLPSSFSSFIIALLNSASSMLHLIRLFSWSCFSLFKDFESKIFSSRAFSLLFRSFKEAKPFATRAKRTTTATHKTSKSTFTTKYERCLLVLDSFLSLFHRFSSQMSENVSRNFLTTFCSKSAM